MCRVVLFWFASLQRIHTRTPAVTLGLLPFSTISDNVRFWHIADIDLCSADVRFRG
jgi:hypothetical protein